MTAFHHAYTMSLRRPDFIEAGAARSNAVTSESNHPIGGSPIEHPRASELDRQEGDLAADADAPARACNSTTPTFRPWLSRWRWPTRLAAPLRRAYRRGDLFEKRRKLMDAWARYCAELPQTGAVLTYPPRGMICGAPTRSSGAPGGVFLVPATPAVATAMPTSNGEDRIAHAGEEQAMMRFFAFAAAALAATTALAQAPPANGGLVAHNGSLMAVLSPDAARRSRANSLCQSARQHARVCRAGHDLWSKADGSTVHSPASAIPIGAASPIRTA